MRAGVVASGLWIDPSGVVVLHETADCGVEHDLIAHSAAGHTAIGTWTDAATYQTVSTGRVGTLSDGFNPRALVDVGGTAMSIEARIQGRTLSAQDLGFTLGSTTTGAQNATDAALVTFGSSSVNGVPYPVDTDPDDFHALAQLAEGWLSVSIDGTPVIHSEAPPAATGTLCGIYAPRARWDRAVGYDDIIVRRL